VLYTRSRRIDDGSYLEHQRDVFEWDIPNVLSHAVTGHCLTLSVWSMGLIGFWDGRTNLNNNRRRDQQQIGDENRPVVPTNAAILDLPPCNETDSNTNRSQDEQSVTNPSGQRPIISDRSLACLFLPCL
jgi:hypothetical protein